MDLRQLTTDDIPAWAELLAAIEAVDDTGEHYGETDLAEEMANPDVEVGKDFLGAYDGPALVGYASVMPRGEADGVFKVHVQGAVRPDRRGEGIGTVLARAMVERGLAAGRERSSTLPVRLTTTGMTSNEAQADLLTGLGMRGERWNFVMRTSLDDLGPELPLAEGYAFVPYDESMGDAVLDAHNAAFGGHHPNFTPWTPAMWKQWVTGSHTFRPATSVVVVPEGADTVVGYVTTHECEAYERGHRSPRGLRRQGRRPRGAPRAGHRRRAAEPLPAPVRRGRLRRGVPGRRLGEPDRGARRLPAGRFRGREPLDQLLPDRRPDRGRRRSG